MDECSFQPLAFKELFIRPEKRPLARSGHRIVATKHFVYCFGGFNPNVPEAYDRVNPNFRFTKPLFKELWRFSKLTYKWQRLITRGQAPDGLVSNCALLVNDRTLLVYGGSGFPFGEDNSNGLYKCDLDQSTWTLIEHANDPVDENVPMPGYGQTMVLDRENECLYVCGGTSGYEYTLDLHRFDFNTRRWNLVANTPDFIEPRYRHEMVLHENRLFILGGGTIEQTFANDQVAVYDLIGNEWKLVPTLCSGDRYPDPRLGHAIGQHAHLVYVAGGLNQGEVLHDFWVFNLCSVTWHRLNVDLSDPLYFHSAAITPEGEFTVFGGKTSLTGRERSNSLHKLWVQPPKLSTLCMHAVMDKLRSDNNRAHHDFESSGYNILPEDTIREYFQRERLRLDFFNVPDDFLLK